MRSLHGIHWGKDIAPPQLQSIQEEDNRKVFDLLCEANDCAEYMVAFLQMSESLEADGQKQKTKDSEEFKVEKKSLWEIAKAWCDHILIPVNEEASRRLHLVLKPRAKAWSSVLKNLRERINELNGRLAAKYPSIGQTQRPVKMPVASP